MTSEEFRTNPFFLRNQFPGSGVFEMPVIRKQQIPLDEVSFIGYDKLNERDYHCIVHFFLDDYKFEVLWKDPEPRIERLKQYRAVLSPQFSLYTEMPAAVKIHNIFRSRWCGAYFQSKGIPVIPSLVWGGPESFWYCFDGIENGSIVAVSTLGMRTEKDLFMNGYREMLRRISPETVICYGAPFDEMDGNVIPVDYAETNHLSGSKSEAVTLDSFALKGGGSAIGSIRLPKGVAQLKHIFADRPGHLPDTPENRALLENVSNNNENFVGVDSLGLRWYSQIQPDGSQIWVKIYDGVIADGGINSLPRPWDPLTGFNNNPNKHYEQLFWGGDIDAFLI